MIEFAVEVLGIDLMPWQRWLYIHALELLPSGEFRFRTVVVLVARQNGKSTFAQILALFFMYVRGVALVIGTAQNLDVAEEVWAGAVDLAQETEELAEEIKRVNQTNGKKALELYGGIRYKVQAANRRGGRGLSGDLVLLDELREHQTWQAWAAITKTTLARALAQVWGLSNAGDSTSVVLRHLRMKGHAAAGDPDGIVAEAALVAPEGVEEVGDDSIGLFEWSARPDRDRGDRKGWAEANPALGYTITERAIAAAYGTDPVDVFWTEVLCQWGSADTAGPFPPGSWAAGKDDASEIADDSRLAWCVDVSADRGAAHIAVAGVRFDGDLHAEIAATGPGVDWLVPWFSSRTEKGARFRVCLQARGAPVSSLRADLAEVEGVEVVDWSGSELGNASSQMWDLVHSALWEPPDGDPDAEPPAMVYHLTQPLLDVAAEHAATKSSGDGPFLIDRTNSPVDASPLVAFAGALWLLRHAEEEQRSAYEDAGLLIV